MKKIITCFMLFLAPFFLEAQQMATNYKDLADKSFNNKEYYAAAVYYQKVIDGQHNANDAKPYQSRLHFKKVKTYQLAELYFRLAESFRLYENYINAEPWYYKVLEDPEAAQYPLARLWYGVCLRANQQFDESIKQLETFLASAPQEKKYGDRAREEIANCKFAQYQYSFPHASTVVKLKNGWNSDGSNYSLVKTGENNFYITSSRYTSPQNSKKAKPHLNRIFYVVKNSNAAASLQEIDFDNSFSKDAEWGTPTISANGKSMYFTHWFKEGDKITHAIYRSENISGKQWSAPEKLNAFVNSSGFNAIQPFITPDGKQLYFASNKPGTHGAYDIWVSELDDNGNPKNSLNLGPTINTERDEQAPYYDEKSKHLIYSSKGFIGLGGFDFMESSGSVLKWTVPSNMGFPMNSAKDDLYYFPDPDVPGSAFISSDRESDCCLELFTIKNSTYQIKGLLVDCEDQNLLPGIKVSLVEPVTKHVMQQAVTDQSGTYRFEVADRKSYQLILEKEGYFTKLAPVVWPEKGKTDTLFNPDICLKPFKVGKPIVLKDIYFDYNKAELRPQSKVVLDTLAQMMKDNPQIKIELSAHTDAIGGDDFNLKLSQNRAQSCTDYLIQTGIKADRIIAKGYGETRPVAPNTLPNGKDNPEGRQQNRRTEFTVL